MAVEVGEGALCEWSVIFWLTPRGRMRDGYCLLDAIIKGT